MRRNGKQTDRQFTAEDFVRAWQSATSLAAAAQALGIPIDQARGWAHRFRRKGIPLKKFSRSGVLGKIDVEKLKKLAGEITPL